MPNNFLIKYISAHKNRDINKLSMLYKLPFLVRDNSGVVSYLETKTELEMYIDRRLSECNDISSVEYVGNIGSRFTLFNIKEYINSDFITRHLVVERIGERYFLISEE